MHDVTDQVLQDIGSVIAVHLNYPSRAAQRGRTPEHPSYFLKPTSSLARSGAEVQRPAGTELLAYEGEVALMIGTRTYRATPEQGWAAVSWVTAANDWGLYDMRTADKGSNLRNKGGAGFTPLGPALIPAREVDPAGLRVRTWVNGTVVQDDTTDTLLFDFGRLIADLSQWITLQPGDVILTGTPAGSSVAQPGDVVEVEVSTIDGGLRSGRLASRVTEGTVPANPAYGITPTVTDDQRIEAWGDEEAWRSGSAGAAAAPAAPVHTAPETPTPAKPETPETTASVLPPDLRRKLEAVATATLSSQLRKRGLNNVSIDGLHCTRDGAKVVGLARTLRYVPNREDLFAEHGGGYNAQKRIVDDLHAGDVLVMEARGEKGAGTLGDILALRAQVAGAAAIITDGGVRDAAVVAELAMPTFYATAHPAVLGRKHVPWDTDVAVACGGTTVVPGDIIVADADGILVIPPALAEELVEESLAQEHEEEFIYAQVEAGHPVDGLFPLNAAWRGKYDAWAAEHPREL
ncbi:fumarylacetoacetate hydrolase family protein [Tersicoccus sp. MR15.9]|uniref:fumarylacetoacetate hydrolase family protein n=1 Tax=Tersicoccus mangrovi TaxID=3121635 RepID=UPI002FE595AB